VLQPFSIFSTGLWSGFASGGFLLADVIPPTHRKIRVKDFEEIQYAIPAHNQTSKFYS